MLTMETLAVGGRGALVRQLRIDLADAAGVEVMFWEALADWWLVYLCVGVAGACYAMAMNGLFKSRNEAEERIKKLEQEVFGESDAQEVTE